MQHRAEHRGGHRGYAVKIRMIARRCAGGGGGEGNIEFQPLQLHRDPYPSREALPPSSDRAFFFSFSRLSNPCGEGYVSWAELCAPSSAPFPQGGLEDLLVLGDHKLRMY